MQIEFEVSGTPQPQGSMSAYVPKGWNRPILTSANKKLKPWRIQVGTAAKLVMNGSRPLEGPVRVEARFYFERPKSSKSSVIRKSTRPDICKLSRALHDSLTGIVYIDDAQIAELRVDKIYDFSASTWVRVTKIEV